MLMVCCAVLPPHVLEAEVLWNPFEDIKPRRDARREREEAEQRKCDRAQTASPAYMHVCMHVCVLVRGHMCMLA